MPNSNSPFGILNKEQIVGINLQTQNFPGWNLKPARVWEYGKWPKKEAGHSRLIGGRFNKQGNLYTRLALVGHKMSRSTCACTRTSPFPWILEVYIEALTEFSHILSPDGLSNTLHSQGCVLEIAPSTGMVGRMYTLETHPIAQVQPVGQPKVTSSWWPPIVKNISKVRGWFIDNSNRQASSNIDYAEKRMLTQTIFPMKKETWL